MNAGSDNFETIDDTVAKVVIHQASVWEQFGEYYGNLQKDKYFDVYVFSLLTLATVIVTLGRSFYFFNVAMRASKNLHNSMFSGLTRASMYFFNTNPSGRILNRFSKDLGQIDDILPTVMIDIFQVTTKTLTRSISII